MKQTPIPEKPSHNRSVKLSSTLGGQREQLREHHNLFCALIDVLTEQQKEIEELKAWKEKYELYVGTRIGTLDKLLTEIQLSKPYTAMRSTGESEFCTCENIYQTEKKICGLCHRSYINPQPPTPSDEEIEYKVMDLLNEFWTNGRDVGKSEHTKEFISIMETKPVADKILTLVRGKV